MKVLTSWPLPVFMILVFAAMLSNSDASSSGILAAGFGLALVLGLWGVFREYSTHAEISRALSIGDGAAALVLIERQLGRRRRASRRTPFLIYRAMAHELGGDWLAIEQDLAELKDDGGAGSWQLVAACLQIGGWCERGDVRKARARFDEVVTPRLAALGDQGSVIAGVAHGRLLAAEGDLAGAQARLAPMIRNIRLGPAQRAIAHFYLARCARAEGREADAARLQQQAATLAPTSWFAAVAPPQSHATRGAAAAPSSQPPAGSGP